jgi:hypothetical protein
LESSVPQLCESLMSSSTAAAALQVFYNVALAKPQILSDHLKHIRATAENQPKTALTAIQVLTLVAKSRKVGKLFLHVLLSDRIYRGLSFQDKAQETMDFILSMLGRLESDKHTMVLKEIISLVHR